MLELGKQIGRQRAHDAVYEAAQASVTQARPFRETLAEDLRGERPAHAGPDRGVAGPRPVHGLVSPVRRAGGRRAREVAAALRAARA